jgi:hypothetical protein
MSRGRGTIASPAKVGYPLCSGERRGRESLAGSTRAGFEVFRRMAPDE